MGWDGVGGWLKNLPNCPVSRGDGEKVPWQSFAPLVKRNVWQMKWRRENAAVKFAN